MMLIVLSNVLLFSIRWFCDKWRYNRYFEVMNRLLTRMSVLIHRRPPLKLSRQEMTTGVLKMSLGLDDTKMLLSSSQLIMKDDFLMMHKMKSWPMIDLSTWVTDRYSIQSKANFESSPLHVLLEAVLCDKSEAQDDDTVHPVHDLSYHILTFGTPVAWRADEPYGLIMRCDTLDSMVRMIDAFGQLRLVVSSGLAIASIGTVRTTGIPRAVSASREIFSPASDNEDEIYTRFSNAMAAQDNESSVAAKTAEKSNGVSDDDTSSQSNEIKTSEATTSQSAGMGSTSINKYATSYEKSSAKPPNILIYCGAKDTKRKFEEVLESIKGCVNTDSYTIYHLKQEHISTTPWQDNTAALVVSGCVRLQPDVEQKINEYVFRHNGKLLSFGSSADKLFTNHLDVVNSSNKEEITTFDFQDWKLVSSCCSQFSYSNCKGGAQVIIPAGHVTTGSCHAYVVKLNLQIGGSVILSQLFLERDPVSQAKDKQSFDILKESNQSRLAVLRELLTLLGLDTKLATPPVLTPGCLLVQRKSLKESFMASFKSRLRNGILKSKKMNLFFPSEAHQDQEQTQTEPKPDFLPILTQNDSDTTFDYFNMPDYWHHLKTSRMGQVVVYTDVISSTMPVFDGLLFSIPKEVVPVAIAGRQVHGKGRSDNSWLSPSGCAMFTLPLTLELHSHLGQRSSYLQHLMALAVVKGVVSLHGYEDIDLRLKWPNDIYYGRMKLGGVMVLSTIMENTIYATIGCGVNVSNSHPTICINDIIQHRNLSNPDLPPLTPLTTGQVIAQALTVLEQLVSDFESKGHEYIGQLYCQYWMHGNCKVTVDLETKSEGEIVGLDEYGFLSIRTTDGKLITVQPDGNSFDMMHNLIHVKSK